jgi:transposase
LPLDNEIVRRPLFTNVCRDVSRTFSKVSLNLYIHDANVTRTKTLPTIVQMGDLSNDNHWSTRRSTILHFWQQGHRNAADIARMTKIPERTIRYNIAKIRDEGRGEHRGGNGRPRKITRANSVLIGQWLRRNNEITSKEFAEKLLQTRNLNVPRWTVQRQLNLMGYKSTLPRATPMLTREQKERRIQWAQQHLDDNWNRTIFSDESSFQLFRNTVRRWSKNPRQEVKRIPKNRQKIMVWGAISVKGQIGFHSFRRTMDGPYYVEILEDNLIDEARKKFGYRWRRQQDNDPKHTSRIAKDFLQQEVPETIDWPSNSPDANPIENVWSVLERRVEKRHPSSIDELDRFLKEEWKKVDKSLLINLIRSMKTRCMGLIDSKG